MYLQKNIKAIYLQIDQTLYNLCNICKYIYSYKLIIKLRDNLLQYFAQVSQCQGQEIKCTILPLKKKKKANTNMNTFLLPAHCT